MASVFATLTDVVSSAFVPSKSTSSSDRPVSTNAFRLALHKKLGSTLELDAYIKTHLAYIRNTLATSSQPENETAELLQQCLICKTLGADASFCGIYAVQLAQSAQLWRNKALAYQACCATLTDRDEISTLMVATLQRDLRASNAKQICLALMCASDLVNSQLVPAVEPIVTERARHPSAYVRRKAIACLGSFIRKRPELAPTKLTLLMTMLMDKDLPCVQIAVHILSRLPQDELVVEQGLMLNSLLHVIQHTLDFSQPAVRTHGRVLMPFLLSNLFLLLKSVWRPDDAATTKIVQRLVAIVDAVEKSTSNAAVAVLAECCRVLPSYTLSQVHLERVSAIAGSLFKSNTPNYEHVALLILEKLSGVSKQLVEAHQSAIVKELGSKDGTLASRSLKLIISLTNASNVVQIFQLFKNLAHNPQRSLNVPTNAINIISCCPLKELPCDWFVDSLLYLLSFRPLREYEMDKLLSYLQGQQKIPVDVYKQMTAAVKLRLNGDLSPDLLTVWLWMCSECGTTDSDELCEILGQVTISHSIHSPLPVLILIRRASNAARQRLSPSQRDLVNKCISQCGIFSLPYAEDISELNDRPPVKLPCDESVVDTIDSFVTSRIKSSSCRTFADGPRTKDGAEQFVFTAQPDTKNQPEKVVSADVPQVWTARGHKAVVEEPATSAPNQQPQDDLDETTKLANQIFSTI